MPGGLEGQSFERLLEDTLGSIKKAGCSWYPKGGYQGVAMRTDRWRFVEWRKAGSPDVYELYDHQKDAEENENLANKPEHSAIVKELSAMLRANLKAKP